MRCAIRGDNASQRPRTTRPEQHQVTHLDCHSVSRLCLMPWQDTDGFGSVRSVLMLQSGFWDAGSMPGKTHTQRQDGAFPLLPVTQAQLAPVCLSHVDSSSLKLV
jgi:hypothetical protein